MSIGDRSLEVQAAIREHVRLAALFEQLGERPALDKLHHVVRWIAVPGDVEQLDDVTIGREEDQLLDLAVLEQVVDDRVLAPQLKRDALGGSQRRCDGQVAWSHLRPVFLDRRSPPP